MYVYMYIYMYYVCMYQIIDLFLYIHKTLQFSYLPRLYELFWFSNKVIIFA